MSASVPRVSVVTSVYNEMPWLPVAIESVLAQTFSDFEFLLVSDGALGECPDVLRAYAARDSRIRVIWKDNGGQVSGLNRGLAEARAPYVARLDADDLMYPERLAKQVAYLDAHPEVALVGSQVDWAAPTGTTRWHTPTDAHLARWTLALENGFMGGGVTFRADAVRAVGGYDTGFEYAEDYDLWERLAARFDVVNLPETLAWFNNLRVSSGTRNRAQQEAAAMHVSLRALQRALPDATLRDAEDLYATVRGGGDGAHGLSLRRLAGVARTLARYHEAFASQHPAPAAQRRLVSADLHARLMRVRLAMAARGGVGQLARLHRPRLDRGAHLLRLPALLAS